MISTTEFIEFGLPYKGNEMRELNGVWKREELFTEEELEETGHGKFTYELMMDIICNLFKQERNSGLKEFCDGMDELNVTFDMSLSCYTREQLIEMFEIIVEYVAGGVLTSTHETKLCNRGNEHYNDPYWRYGILHVPSKILELPYFIKDHLHYNLQQLLDTQE